MKHSESIERVVDMKTRHYIEIMLLAIYIFVMTAMLLECHRLYARTVAEGSIESRVETVRNQTSYIRLQQTSPVYVQTLIQLEDERFYQHHGLDYLKIVQDLNPFKQREHASITEQTVKNIFISNHTGLPSRIVCGLLAKQMENMYTKDEILELYLNTQYFGEGYYGIGNASRAYFHKDPDRLNQTECMKLLARQRQPEDWQAGLQQIERQLADQDSVLQRLENWFYNFGVSWVKAWIT